MGAHKKTLTTKEICQELGLTIKQLRRIMAAHPDGVFTYMGRRWKATKQGSLSNSPYIFDEIAASTAADQDEDSDLRSMSLEDLKREKYIAEIKTIRQKWREERDRMRQELIDQLNVELHKCIYPLVDELGVLCDTQEKRERWRTIVLRFHKDVEKVSDKIK